MNNRARGGWWAFAAMAVAQLLAPAAMIAQRELALRRGESFRFRTQPVDPYDAFRGRYVRLQLTPNEAPRPDGAGWDRPRAAYVVLATDTNGYAAIAEIRARSDPARPGVRARVRPAGTGRVRVEWPVDRFYMEEKRAPRAEALVRERGRDRTRAAAVALRVWRGGYAVENLLVDGRPIAEWLDTAPP